MPIGERILTVTLDMPNGQVVLDQTLELRVRIRKDALAIQNTCSIEVINLSRTLRESLLSTFTAWNKRNLETGQPGYQQTYVNVTIQAGYRAASQDTTTTVFVGQVALCSPTEMPPNIGVRLECYSQQLSKLQWITDPAPTKTTFKAYVMWAAKQMGVDKVVCETSYDNTPIDNPGANVHVASDLIIDIQNAYRPNVVAFIDDNTLYVKDVNKIISTAQIITVSEFIGTPMWNEWGVEFRSLFDARLSLAGAATLKSEMNPSLNQTFVISGMEYDLTSRDNAFYVHVNCNPSA